MRIIARLNVGGPALHCLLLSSKLNEHGFTTTLVTGRPSEGEASYEELFKTGTEGFEILRLGKMQRGPSVFGDLVAFLQLVRAMHRLKPDVVHTHTAKAGVLGRLAAFICRVPVTVHTFHGHVLSGYFSPGMSKLVCWVERALAWKTTAIVTLSPALRDELSQGFKVAPASKFRIVPLGRDLARFAQASSMRGLLREELGITDPETRIIACVGRLVPIKDHETLFQALVELKRISSVKWVLAIVGEGPLGDSLVARARELGIADQVRFLGWRSDLPKIYGDSDVVVLSSRNEGTPLSIIEAFASGCPVVATRVGGVEDLFSQTGTDLPHLESDKQKAIMNRAQGALVDAGDFTGLAEALKLILGDADLRKRCGAEARVASAGYSDERLAQNIGGLYRELLDLHG